MSDVSQTPPGSPIPEPASWYLEGILDNGRGNTWRTAVRPLPFLVGRRASCDLPLRSPSVSQSHARLLLRGNVLWVHDLGSTNGTFVNGKGIDGEQALAAGDVLQFADVEFRLLRAMPDLTQGTISRTMNLETQMLPGGGAMSYREIRAMLRDGDFWANFQPLVSLQGQGLIGYEALGRGALAGVETFPGELFLIAESIGIAAELSAAFRDKAAHLAEKLPGDPLIFLNTHPDELAAPHDLLDSLANLRIQHPEQRLVLEIHESAIPGLESLRELREKLHAIDIDLAFDDFGTGQARLLELIDVVPGFLKFDALFIRDIHKISGKRWEMVEALVRMTREMGIATVAEGVENAEEEAACRELGFEIAQGYHLGRPVGIEKLSGEG